ncbi:hypothetical protein BDV12DRAFT_191692 [Aspergillus spectabilis]
MAPCNNRVFLSKLLKFTVGTACEEVVIHSDMLKLHSTPWFDANSGSFPGDGSIKDADAHTFSLVCQYLYTVDYSITLPSDMPPPDLTSDRQEKPEHNHAIILEGNLFKDTETVEKFADYLVRQIQPQPSEGSQGSYDPNTDYTKILLTHARLHTFAVRYELQELRDICLFKLLHLLHVFLICQDRVGDIVQLIDLAFDTDTGQCENLTTIFTKFQVLLQEQPTLANLLLKTLVGGL